MSIYYKKKYKKKFAPLLADKTVALTVPFCAIRNGERLQEQRALSLN